MKKNEKDFNGYPSKQCLNDILNVRLIWSKFFVRMMIQQALPRLIWEGRYTDEREKWPILWCS